MKHVLKPLPYAPDALEPHYDRETVSIHHGKHHQAYVDNLNELLEDQPGLQAKDLEALLEDLDAVPEAIRQKVANNAGGIWNHDFFWQGMGPAGKETGGAPSGPFAAAIDAAFGNFDAFKARFKEAALSVFGSGWVFLVADRQGRLSIETFVNQDTPVGAGVKPLLTLDVWEHAYYLKFRNRRPEWVDSWWNVVDWDAVVARYE
jgi:superoxide dismutase, Fe-Mn family